MENMEAGAVVAGLGIRYLLTDKPLLTLNRKDQVVKVSARGNRLLVDQGLDLSLALSRAAETVGGAGGGHNVASGASIPPGSEDRFLAMVDEIVGTQLKRQGSAA
jgi:single-stranded DNA-specific DHH superfamily exonuclease